MSLKLASRTGIRSRHRALLAFCFVSVAGCGNTGNPFTGGDLDTDGDGLPDSREQALGFDPDNPDTDGDGASDGNEIAEGTLTTPLLGVSTVPPFDAATISQLYEGRTDEIKQAIIDRFAREFEAFDIVTITSDDAAVPAAGAFSTILFGSFHETAFGVSLGFDAYNINQCDDGIIFTDSFQPQVFGFAPPAVAVGAAIGNVAAHEAGHLMGLYHVTDPTALMDERSPAIHLLTDQVFKTAVLSDSVFPLGVQDALLLLSETVGERPYESP